MENKPYSERFVELPSLEYRRKRADVMQTYTIMNNIDIIDEKKLLKPCNEVRTRGHSKRVQKIPCKSLVRGVRILVRFRVGVTVVIGLVRC